MAQILETNQPTPSKGPVTPETFFSGIQTGVEQIGWRKLLTKTISLALLVGGLWGLVNQIRLVFFVYPKLPEYYKALNFDVGVYQKIIIQALLLSVNGLVDAVYGAAILFKPTHLVKNIHLVIGGLLFLVSVYLALQGQSLQPQEILQSVEQAFLLIR